MSRFHVLERRQLPLLIVMLSMGLVTHVSATATDGTIDATNRYAWSENAGWIDFGATEGDVHVTDSALSGYAWSELSGWISLNCSNTSSCATVDYKVTNDGEGTLGGYAWSENTGWIDFDPANGGVTISSSGVFSGYAWGENTGWIVFNCGDESSCATVDYTLSTDWRPSSGRASSSSSSASIAATANGSGGGGGMRPETLERHVAQGRAQILALYQSNRNALGTLAIASSSSISTSSSSPTPTFTPEEAAMLADDRKAQRLQKMANRAQQEDRLLVLVEGQPIVFADVQASAWYAPYVALLLTEGIAEGYKDPSGKPKGEFGVSNPVTRAELLKLALQAADTTLNAGGSPRNQSALGTWASPYVAQAEKMHLTVFPPSTDVNAQATRGEVIQTILEVLRIPTAAKTPPLFTDVPANYPYAPAITIAATYGLIEGDLDAQGHPLNTFRPNDPINRAEVAKIMALARALLQ